MHEGAVHVATCLVIDIIVHCAKLTDYTTGNTILQWWERVFSDFTGFLRSEAERQSCLQVIDNVSQLNKIQVSNIVHPEGHEGRPCLSSYSS